MRLIDLDKLIADIKDNFNLHTDTDDWIQIKERVCGRNQIVKFIESYQPSIDAVLVKHGKWIYDTWCKFRCSKCQAVSKSTPAGHEPYCYNCGAKMN